MFFILAALLAAATLGLFYELMRNPVTHADATPAERGHGFVADYTAVLRSPWARAVIVIAFIESGAMFGAFTYVGADLHLRFGVSFTLVGLFVGTFAIGGLIYSLSVRVLVNRLGQIGLATGGGVLLALGLRHARVRAALLDRAAAITLTGLGFYMLHNTLQTNATQMTPEARGTAVAIFSSALYLGQTAGVAAGGAVFDRLTAVPLFVISGDRSAGAGLWFARQLKRRSGESGLRPAARDALDLGAHDALDQARQVVVEPGLEHRPQHLLHQILERARVLADHGLRQRVERAVDRRDGRGRDQPAVERGCCGRRRRPRWRGWPARLFDNAHRGLGRRVGRPLGEDHVGRAIDGAEDRRGSGGPDRRSHRFGQVEHIRRWTASALASMASMSSWLLPRLAAVARAAVRLRAAARPAGAGTVAAGSGGLAVLPASSSAMMRRMEARISSIEGSWTFADWLIPAFPTALSHATDSPCRRRHERIVACVPFIRQRHGRVAGRNSDSPVMNLWTAQRPSGVRTPAQLSRTCW